MWRTVWLWSLLLVGCVATPPEGQFSYGTDRADALSAFGSGWSRIMDEGRWTEAEVEFRRALELDPDWVMGAALVARITTDVEEREQLLEQIESNLDTVDADSRLLLDVFILNIRAANARDRGQSMEAGFQEMRMDLAVRNFGAFVERHPDETYMQAEYIEWIHAAEGADPALGILNRDVPEGVRSAPFFLSYQARLHAELGHTNRALRLAESYEKALDEDAPGVPALWASLYERNGDFGAALESAERAVALDPKHKLAEFARNRLAKKQK